VHGAKGVSYIDEFGDSHIACRDMGASSGSLEGMATEAAAQIKKFVASLQS
jgi:hypothetical protein